MEPIDVTTATRINPFESLAAIGENHGRSLLTAPLTLAMKAALAWAGQQRATRIYAGHVGTFTPPATLRGLARRHLGTLEYAGGELDAFRLNDSGKREAARLAEGKLI